MALRKPIAQTRRDRAAMIASLFILASCGAFGAALVVPAQVVVLAGIGIGAVLAIVGLAFAAMS